MRYDGNTGALFNNPKTLLIAPEGSQSVAFDADTVTIREGGYYEIFMFTSCDTTTLGSSLYGGFVLEINGEDQQDCQCLIPSNKFSILTAQQIYELNAGDTIKIKNENSTVGSVCSPLNFQIRKLDF